MREILKELEMRKRKCEREKEIEADEGRSRHRFPLQQAPDLFPYNSVFK